LAKPKPKNPKPNSEWITFSGDLYGDQEVVDCCPNAGPNPEYTMTLSKIVFPQEVSQDEKPHDGNIFMNSFGRNMPWDYLVKFWWTETEGGTEYFIEIRGGEAQKDKKTKILTVVFTGEECNIWIDDVPQPPVTVTFTLIRDPHHPANK